MQDSAVKTPENNPILQGNFAPVAEEINAENLKVTGTIPESIKGALLRNGPNPIAPGDNHHWFMGDGMLHGIHIANGEAKSYLNRWVRTPVVEELKGLPAAAISPNQPMLQVSGNVNVIQHAGHILALPEVGLPYEMDGELNTLGQYDFNSKLASNMTAHPKIDGKTGELVFFGYDFMQPFLRYHHANAAGEMDHSIEIDMPAAVMMHDFGVSATRVVFMDLPVVFDLEMVAKGMPFRWSEDHQSRLGVMPRKGTAKDIQWIDIDACYVYHPVNTYDDGDNIVMDVVRHNNSFIDGEVFSGDLSELVRWTINPDAGTVTSEVLNEIAQEFPVINPAYECYKNRYAYALALQPNEGGMAFSGLLKHDFEKGLCEKHEVGEGREAGEGIFVPAQGESLAEDAGYVLSVVYDQSTHTSDVIIVDAQNFSAPPVAIIHLPVRVPFGFHGCFVNI